MQLRYRMCAKLMASCRRAPLHQLEVRVVTGAADCKSQGHSPFVQHKLGRPRRHRGHKAPLPLQTGQQSTAPHRVDLGLLGTPESSAAFFISMGLSFEGEEPPNEPIPSLLLQDSGTWKWPRITEVRDSSGYHSDTGI